MDPARHGRPRSGSDHRDRFFATERGRHRSSSRRGGSSVLVDGDALRRPGFGHGARRRDPDDRRRDDGLGLSMGRQTGHRPSVRDSPPPRDRELYSRDLYSRDLYSREPYSRGRSPRPPRRHGSPRGGGRSHSLDRYGDSTHRRHARGGDTGKNGRRRSSATVSPSRPQQSSSHVADHDGTRNYPSSARRSGASRARSRPRRSPSPDRDDSTVWRDMVKCAAEAGAMAALKARKDPGQWVGSKGASVATAAIGAAVVDTLVDRRLPSAKGGVRHAMAKEVAQSALSRLVPRKGG